MAMGTNRVMALRRMLLEEADRQAASSGDAPTRWVPIRNRRSAEVERREARAAHGWEAVAVVDISTRATAESVPELRHATVRAFRAIGGAEAKVADVALAVSEACTNVVRHAYQGTHPGPVNLRAWVEDKTFVVQVVDSGVGIDACSSSSGSRLGISLMCAVTDCQFTNREGGGTEVRMAVPLGLQAPRHATG